MTCEEIEDLIWLYDDLSADQRKAVDDHLITCAECQYLREQSLALISVAEKTHQPVPDNAAQLTRRIMDAIGHEAASHHTRYHWLDWINVAWLRYSLAGVSLILILTLFLEKGTHSSNPVSYDAPSPRVVVLRSTGFIEKVVRAKRSDEKKYSLTSCITKQDCPPSFYERRTNYENPQ